MRYRNIAMICGVKPFMKYEVKFVVNQLQALGIVKAKKKHIIKSIAAEK